MIVELCDCCAGALPAGKQPMKYPIIEEGSPYPRMVTCCDECAGKVTKFLEGLEDLPDEVTLPLKSKPEEVEGDATDNND